MGMEREKGAVGLRYIIYSEEGHIGEKSEKGKGKLEGEMRT